jgi:hypothetical protein
VVPVRGGGSLVHFLSDQQWCLHWLLYAGADGGEAVVATYPPYGHEADGYRGDPVHGSMDLEVFDPAASPAVVCTESFSEFLYRYWIENEIWFRAAEGPLTGEFHRYVGHYRRLPPSQSS